MIEGVMGLCIRTSDTKKLAKFYSAILDVPVAHQCPACAYLKLPDGRVIRFRDDKKTVPAVKDEVGNTNIWIVLKVKDVEALRIKLEAKNVKFIQKSGDNGSGDGVRTVSMSDPEGNRVDFLEGEL